MSDILTPDGLYKLDPTTNSWVPNVAPPPPPPAPVAAPPPPPAPPAYALPAAPAYAPGYAPQFAAPPPAPVPSYIPQPMSVPTASASGEISFESVAWTDGFPLGVGFLVTVDDVEAGMTSKENPKVTFTGRTIAPNGHIQAGYKAVWTYVLTEDTPDKRGAIGKLGKDMVALGIKSMKIDRSDLAGSLARGLREQLRGKTLVIDSVERKGSDYPEVSIKAFHVVGATPAQAVAAPAPPPAPAPQQMPPGPPPPDYPAGVSFPTAPPPPGTAFGNV